MSASSMPRAGVPVGAQAQLEPRIAELMALKLSRRSTGPYRTLQAAALTERTAAWLSRAAGEPVRIVEFARLSGGASKEQFVFTAASARHGTERLVMRADPLESIVETCRFREAEILQAVAGAVPVPPVRLLDGDGTQFGQPAVVTRFVSGVTKPPTDGGTSLSGVGTTFTREWRERLAPQFVEQLAAIHRFDWRGASLPHFAPPTGLPEQAALWQVNWWSRVWREDLVSPYPLLTLAEHWMRRNLPRCDAPVVVHGDFRTGNFMFDPASGAITAVLDWELAHLGDFHEDLGWAMQRLFAGVAESGKILACNLLAREDLIAAYERASGRKVNPRTLAFYEILSAFKCAAMNLGTAAGIAQRGNNHQDIVLSWLSSVGHVFASDIARRLAREMQL